METKLKTYRSEQRFEADRPLMEAQGWRVRAAALRPDEAIGALASLDHTLPGRLDRVDAQQQMDFYVSTSGGFSGVNPYNTASVAGCIRTLALPFILVAWPFAWAMGRWRARPRWDVLYERPDAR